MHATNMRQACVLSPHLGDSPCPHEAYSLVQEGANTYVNTNSYQVQTDHGHQGCCRPFCLDQEVPFLLSPTQLPPLTADHWTPILRLMRRRVWEQGGLRYGDAFPPTPGISAPRDEPAASLAGLPQIPSL